MFLDLLTSFQELFDKTISEVVYSMSNIYLLPNDDFGSTAQQAFAKIMKSRIERGTFAPQSTLAQAIKASVTLLERISPDTDDFANQRLIYQNILCDRALFESSISAIISNMVRNLSRDIDVEESALTGALIVASALGDTTLMKSFIGQVDKESWFFGTAIDTAAEYGHIDAVRMLLHHSKHSYRSIHYPPCSSPFQRAIYGGHRDIVQLFLKHYGNVTRWSKFLNGQTGSRASWEHIFCWAAQCDQTDILYMLLRYAPYTRLRRFLESALCHAVQSRATSTINSLLDAGVTTRRLGAQAPDALLRASIRGDVKTVRLLIEHRFECVGNAHNADKLAEYQYYAYLAAIQGHTEVLKLFLQAGVDINGRFEALYFPGHYGVWMMNQVLKSFARPLTYETPTRLAALRGDFHTFCFLVRGGARVALEVDTGPLQQIWLERIRIWEAKCSAGI
jgi:ankyrin repeat protein